MFSYISCSFRLDFENGSNPSFQVDRDHLVIYHAQQADDYLALV